MEDRQSKKDKIMEEDRISQLPDNILGSILSYLTMREAVRTSVLSSRWRYIWTTSISKLNFDPDNMLDTADYSVDIYKISVVQRLIITWKRMLNFINSVNQFLLHLHPDHTIKVFRVHFGFCRNKYARHLDQWIEFAISRGIQELDLDLNTYGYFDHPSKGKAYDFPCDLLYDDPSRRGGSSLKCLRLTACILTPRHPNLAVFKSLTTLDLKYIDFLADEHVENLLSNCPHLQWLSFFKCRNLVHLKIRNPWSSRLKYLSIQVCDLVEVIEICSVDLATFEYKGPLISFSFNNVPRLINLYIHVTYTHRNLGVSTVHALMTKLAADLPQLETLLVHCCCYMEEGFIPDVIPTLANLKKLVIIEIASCRWDLLWITGLLKASPLLQQLHLHLHNCIDMEKLGEIRRPPRWPHNHLKEVVISGIRGYLREIEVAIYVLNNATSLERITIDPRGRYYVGDGKWEFVKACDRWSIIGRPRVLDELQGEVSPRVQLDVL